MLGASMSIPPAVALGPLQVLRNIGILSRKGERMPWFGAGRKVRVSRGRITSRLANLPCLIGIEAGMATHYVARELAALGHDVKEVPPAYPKRFRQGQE
jgi:transposase